MAPPWGKFLYGGKGGPLQKGVISGNLGGSAPHGDLPATGLLIKSIAFEDRCYRQEPNDIRVKFSIGSRVKCTEMLKSTTYNAQRAKFYTFFGYKCKPCYWC